MLEDQRLLTITDFVKDATSVSRSDVRAILRSTTRDAFDTLSILHRCALQLDPTISVRVDGLCALVYGVQRSVRMRPRVVRLALVRGSERDVLVQYLARPPGFHNSDF